MVGIDRQHKGGKSPGRTAGEQPFSDQGDQYYHRHGENEIRALADQYMGAEHAHQCPEKSRPAHRPEQGRPVSLGKTAPGRNRLGRIEIPGVIGGWLNAEEQQRQPKRDVD